MSHWSKRVKVQVELDTPPSEDVTWSVEYVVINNTEYVRARTAWEAWKKSCHSFRAFSDVKVERV